MKVKNIIFKILIFMVIAIMGMTFNSYAADTINLQLDEFRGLDSDNLYNAYAIPSQHVWKIYQKEDNNTVNYDKAIFCLDLHRGFGNGTGEWNTNAKYNLPLNMYSEGETISGYESTYNSSFEQSDYEKIVRILKNVYIKGVTDKEQFLADKITGYDSLSQCYITERDIEFAEQLAIWHYTNNNTTVGDSTNIGNLLKNSGISEMYIASYSNEAKTAIAEYITSLEISRTNNFDLISNFTNKAYYRLDGSDPNSIENNYKMIAQENESLAQGLDNRAYAINEIYKSFLRIAEDTSISPSDENATEPLKMEDLTRSVVNVNNKYIAGPFKITKNNDKYKDLNVWVKDGNGNAITGYEIYTKSGENFVLSESNINTLFNTEYYIGLPENTNIRKVKVGFSAKYEKDTITYWTIGNAISTTQPVAIVEKEDKDLGGEKEVDIPKPTVSMDVEKKWDDSDDAAGKRPTSIKVQLKANGVNIGDEIDLTSPNWKYTWPSLDKYDSEGNIIIYTADEVQIPEGYTKDVVHSVHKSTITNKYEPDKTTREVQKVWDDNNNKEGKRPTSIKVQLKADGVNYGEEVELNNSNGWHHVWGSLDKEKDGQEIAYTIEEKTFSSYEGINRYKTQIDEENGKFTITNTYKPFDLSLRKYITKINDKEISDTRNPQINVDQLKAGNDTTATYNHRKDPVRVGTNNTVTYKLTIYNEGKIDGRATKIVDQLPTGLEFVSVESGNFVLDTYDTTENKVTLKRNEENTTNLEAFVNRDELDSETIEIKCKVTAVPDKANKKILTNVAWISEEIDEEDNVITNQVGADRDSEPETAPNVNKDNMENYKGNTNNNDVEPGNPNYFYKGEQDDDDFEKLYLEPGKEIDLSLRKFITAIGNRKIEDRVPEVDISNLIPNGTEKTARYEHTKIPLGVKIGDIVTYTIRVYNEGEEDAYVGEVIDYLPEELTFISESDSTDTEVIAATEFNASYGWKRTTNDNEIITNVLSKNTDNSGLQAEICNSQERTSAMLKKFDGKTLDYIDLQVKCRVNDKAKLREKITNIAEISKYEDKDGNDVDKDRDSQPKNFPDDKKNNQYEGKENDGKYWEGQEDDDDFERIIVEQFDLALRKYITNIDGKDITDRIPSPDVSKLNTKDSNGNLITTADYNHIKTPITVVRGSKVTYTIRVYNEGDIDGYVNEITDYLPPELEFDKQSEINQEYKWEESADGRKVTTDYLSDKKGTQNLIKAYDIENKKLDYREVKIQCIVKNTAPYQKNITNLAQITEHSDSKGNDEIVDRDSHPNGGFKLPEDKDLPKYKEDEISKLYVPGQEDDDDFEKVNVVYFDLALRKIVSKAIVIENDEQSVIETKHKFEDDPEAIVKVDLGRKKLNNLTVKFEYQIRITNEGLIEGYAKEVKDYIPEGLIFKADENPLWKEISTGVITTDQLKDTLLKPGESKVINVTLTWKNDANNLGLKTNTAEISKDYNEYNTPDIDSTPDNKKDGEDDIDIAEVMLAIALGNRNLYIGLILTILTTTAVGIIGIKKFVL